MNNDPNINLELLIENSKKINSKTFNITRCILLTLLGYYRDGLQFRELKSFLDISDGKLQSNLDFLLEMGYIKKIKTDLDQRSIQIYMIEESGNSELHKIIEWVSILKSMEKAKNDK